MAASDDAPHVAEPVEPTESAEPGAARRRRGSSLWTACAVGVVLGVAEVGWTYRYPDFNPDWRAALPGTLGGFAGFVGVAALVDVAVMLLIGLVCVGLTRLAGMFWGGRHARDSRGLVVRGLIGGAGLTYLACGWFLLFMYPAALRSTWAYWIRLGGTILAAMVLGFFGMVVLDGVARRVHQRMATLGWVAIVLLLLGVTLPAFSRNGGGEKPIEAPVATEAGARPNIVLVTIDTLRYDHVGCSGVIPWIKTPTLDALADDGVRFTQAISQAPTTTPSHCSIMTSVYPTVHDAVNGKPMRRNILTLAHCLRENGYTTAAFTSATTTRSLNSGLDGGFDLYVDSLVPWSTAFSADEFQNLIAFYALGILQNSQVSGKVVSDRALAWLADAPDEPFFLWLHYFDPHSPYGAPPPYRDMYAAQVREDAPMAAERALYAGDVSFADAQLGRVISALQARGSYAGSLIVATSDHGEGFGEKHWGYTEHGHGDHLYDTTQHVPLIIKPPGASTARLIRQQVELIDIAPTILAAAALPQPASYAGQSLWALVTGDVFHGEQRPAYAMTWVEAWDPSKPKTLGQFVAKLAKRTPAWKYVVVDRFMQEELYDLRFDPQETTNTADTHARLCKQSLEDARTALPLDYDSAADPRSRLAPALRRDLEALGYLGGSTNSTTADEEEKTP